MTTDLRGNDAEALFEMSGFSVKTAIVMDKTGLTKEEAEILLDLNEGRISRAIENAKKSEEKKYE